MTVDSRHWRLLSIQSPTLEFRPLMAAGSVARSEYLIESFLIQFTGMPDNIPERLYKSKLGIRAKYEPLDRNSYVSSKIFWLKPTFEPQEFHLSFLSAMISSNLTWRTFEIVRWNKYGRAGVGRNRDPQWGIRFYESIYPQNFIAPTDPTQLPPPDWNWLPPRN